MVLDTLESNRLTTDRELASGDANGKGCQESFGITWLRMGERDVGMI